MHFTDLWLTVDEQARRIRWRWRRWQTARRWGAEALAKAPRLCGGALPRAGSHLLHQGLLGFASIGPFVDPGAPPVNRDAANRKRDEAGILAQLAAMRPGDIRYGYLKYHESYRRYLTASGWATLFIIRDPRDMVVSLMHYIADRQTKHDFHQAFQTIWTTPKARLEAILTEARLPHSRLSNPAERYAKYEAWMAFPEVFTVRFEDLILNRRETLGRVLDLVQQRGAWTLTLPREQALDALEAAIQPHRSGTFRKGQPGEWRQWFDDDLKRLFKERTGDLLIRLGYERDHDW